MDARFGQGLIDGPDEPLKPRIEARLGVGRDCSPRMHRAGRIDRADRDLGAADVDAQSDAAHGSASSRAMSAAASRSQRQIASPWSHRNDAGSVGVTRRDRKPSERCPLGLARNHEQDLARAQDVA